jgi:cobalt transporter subunit CbtA
MQWDSPLGVSMERRMTVGILLVLFAIELNMLNRVLFIGLIAGLVSGVSAALVQFQLVQPLIVQAEAAEAVQLHDIPGHMHDDEAAAHTHVDVEEPSDDPLTRGLSTALAVICTAIGYGLMASSVMFLLGLKGSKAGLLLGAAGFLSIQLLPALGVAPQPPGLPSYDVHLRQLWWGCAALSAALACSLAFLGLQRRKLSLGAVAVFLMFLPHLVRPWLEAMGPVPRIGDFLNPFVAASATMTSTLWLTLGVTAGLLYARLQRPR